MNALTRNDMKEIILSRWGATNNWLYRCEYAAFWFCSLTPFYSCSCSFFWQRTPCIRHACVFSQDRSWGKTSHKSKV